MRSTLATGQNMINLYFNPPPPQKTGFSIKTNPPDGKDFKPSPQHRAKHRVLPSSQLVLHCSVYISSPPARSFVSFAVLPVENLLSDSFSPFTAAFLLDLHDFNPPPVLGRNSICQAAALCAKCSQKPQLLRNPLPVPPPSRLDVLMIGRASHADRLR